VVWNSDVNPTLVALADPTRRAICQRLAHGRATVGQLAGLFPISRPAVSQHLRVLKEAGLIRTETDNRLSAYELVAGPLRDVEAWANHVLRTWENAQYETMVYDAGFREVMT
jgi:DNA-binding transcriptional ArsR family regulator